MKKRKIMYTVFFIFLITITCIIVDINRKGIKNKREKVLSAENNSITEAPGIISEEQQHNYYFKAMKNEQEEINYVKENGKFAYKYCFCDIDKNGIDELIVQGDYYNYAIYTLKGDKVEGLAWNKYGGNLKIYPTKGIFCWEGGHNNSEYIEYIGIKGTQAKEAASKSWLYKFTEDSMHPYHYVYKINGMKVTKKEYKKYVDALKKEKAITASKLKWRQ